MQRGFLNSKTKETKTKERRIVNEEDFLSSSFTYVLDTLHGFHSGLAKIYLGIVECPPVMEELLTTSTIGDEEYYDALSQMAEGYFERTAVSFIERDDEYVNNVFDNFRKQLGGKLPCCFYYHLCTLMNAILSELAKQKFDLPRNKPPEEILEYYLDHVDQFIEQSIEQKKQTYLGIIKQSLATCSKSMEQAIQLNGTHGIIKQHD